MAGPILNRIVLVGKVDSQPEVVFGNEAQSTKVSFNLFVQRPQFSSDLPAGSDLIPVVFIGKLADSVASQVKKDSLILVEGSIHTRQVNSSAGTTLYLTEVSGRYFVVLDQNDSAGRDTAEETIDDVPF